jgi:aspartokinase
VLFEDAVRFARDQGIEIRAVSTFGPGAGTRLTVDVALGAAPEEWVVTGDRQLRRIVGGRLDDAVSLREQGGRIRRCVGDVWFVDTRNVHGALALPLAVDEGQTAVMSVVGSAAGEDACFAMRLTSRLSEGQVDVIRAGFEGDTVWWEIAPSQLNAAVRLAHEVVRALSARP